MDPLPPSGSWLLSAIPIELTSKLPVMKSTVLVAETSTNVKSNRRSQDYTHADDHKSPRSEIDTLPPSGSWLLSALPIELTSKLTVMKSTA